MNALLLYLLASILTSALLLGYYWVALRNRDCHEFNRVYLLTALVLSIVLPLVRVDWSLLRQGTADTLGGFVYRVAASGNSRAEHHPFLLLSLMVLPCLASVALLSRYVMRILFIYRLKYLSTVRRMDGYDLIETEDARAPFSFLDNLFWHSRYDIADPVNRRILDHELAHIRGRHSWDTLFAGALAGFCWMNPFFRVIGRELSMVHEFIADRSACDPGDQEGFARMLLRAHNQGVYLESAQAFFHSPVKRRIAMITNIQSPGRALARKALALPVLGIAFLLFSCGKEAIRQKSESVTVLSKLRLDDQVRIGSKLLPVTLTLKLSKQGVDSLRFQPLQVQRVQLPDK